MKHPLKLTVLHVLAAFAAAAAFAAPARSAETSVAVAANFTDAAKEIAQQFEKATGHQAVLSFGSTGQLFTQISQDAPFEVFLAADEERPRKAAEEGFAVPESRFTYAVGRLVLFSKDAALVAGEPTLRAGAFEKLALANPTTAPYGAAAIEVMKKLGVHDALRPRFVQGNDIAQTYQFISTGNADLGFVALAQLSRVKSGSRWIVPESLHAPIHQDAVLLRKGAQNAAARSFLEFLRKPQAHAVLEKYGYGFPRSAPQSRPASRRPTGERPAHAQGYADGRDGPGASPAPVSGHGPSACSPRQRTHGTRPSQRCASFGAGLSELQPDAQALRGLPRTRAARASAGPRPDGGLQARPALAAHCRRGATAPRQPASHRLPS